MNSIIDIIDWKPLGKKAKKTSKTVWGTVQKVAKTSKDTSGGLASFYGGVELDFERGSKAEYNPMDLLNMTPHKKGKK